ncbi:hypothetical protein V2J09_004331 [Rumex salicifolius]
MEKLALASAKPVLGLGYPTRTLLPLPLTRHSTLPKSRATVRAAASPSGRRVITYPKDKLRSAIFARISSASDAGQETSSVGVNSNLAVPPSSSNFGSPLFWIGVGVGLSALFSWLASYLKKYAMQQAMKTMMGQMAPQNSPFGASSFSTGSPFSYPPPSANGSTATPGVPFPFPTPSASGAFASPVTVSATNSASTTTPRPITSHESAATVDISASKVEATPTTNVKTDEEVKLEPKRIAFEDISPEEGLPKSPFEKYEAQSTSTAPKDVKDAEVVTENGAATASASASNEAHSTGNASPLMSVEALEKMMEDPTVQQMVYPHLPEEMRNPATFKWMLQNPEYRKQLQDMLNNMGGSARWDNRMMDTMKNFDLRSPEVKQQFDQIGLTPEEVISKIMANPDVAMAFQNPRVQAAIMDCSQNPFNIAKYQNDKEVMDMFNKISELFPGVTGYP